MGGGGARGVYESRERYGASRATATGRSAALVNEPSRGFGVRARRWRAGGLPRGAGEGLARCEQSSTYGNLLLYEG